jgi:succinate dehydrogenase / fumarate reductase, cytochrome b subunit
MAGVVVVEGEFDMSNGDRPLSPHLQIYAWQWTMALSILHRATGVGLAGGTLLMVWWLLALANGAESFDTVQMVIGSWIGRLCLLGWTWALFYHFCNGIRHLFWDIGKGFELDTARNSGYTVVVASIVFTGLAWVAGYMAMGAM